MGEQRNRLVRSSSQRSQLLSAMLSGGAVAAVAVAFAVAGVDDVEVLATLFFAPVFIAAMLGGRAVGYSAAAAATLAYLGLRYGDIADSGALRVAVLVAARAVCYGVVAQATPNLQNRFVGLSGAAAFHRAAPRHKRAADVAPKLLSEPEDELDDAAPEYPDSSDWPEREPAFAGGDGASMPLAAEWGDPPPAEAWGPPDAEPSWGSAEPAWDDAPLGEPVASAELAPTASSAWDAPVGEAAGLWDPPTEALTAPEPVGPPGPLADDRVWAPPPPYRPATPEGVGSGWGDPVSPPADAARAQYMSPPAPTVPTGWVDDATVPLGDETIPLGYTGELFLPRDLHQPPGFPSPAPARRNGSTNGGSYPALPPADERYSDHDLPMPRPGGGPPYGAPAGPGSGAPGLGPPGPGGLPGAGAPPPLTPQPEVVGSTPDRSRASSGGAPTGLEPASAGVDPETRLWNARFFRDRLTMARDESRRNRSPFSVVMIQVADEPFQPLPYRRQVALLRELGHQFIQARMIDHLVHLPDGAQHWFAVVLPDTGRPGAHLLERRLRSAIASYLRSRGLHLSEIQSASLTSPDDDEAMSSVWASLLGSTSVS